MRFFASPGAGRSRRYVNLNTTKEKTLGTNLVEREILQERCSGWVGMEDSEHFLTCIGKKLLRIPRIGDRLTLLGVADDTQKRSESISSVKAFPSSLQLDMSQVDVGNVPNENPPHFEHTLPLVRCPYGTTASVVDLEQKCEPNTVR